MKCSDTTVYFNQKSLEKLKKVNDDEKEKNRKMLGGGGNLCQFFL